MQRRYWNYKDEDYTLDMNHRDFVPRPHGRYSGFFLEEANETLSFITLGHAEDGKNVRRKIDIGFESTFIGSWVTRQGVMVHEDAPISVAIDPNSVALPRIDIVVGSHEYKRLAGGEQASYSVVAGSPSSNPIAPSVLNSDTDVIIGYLLMPANAQSPINAIWTPAFIPDFGQDESVAHKDRDQEYGGFQAFRSALPMSSPSVGVIDRETMVLTLPTYLGEDNIRRPYTHYDVQEVGNTNNQNGFADVEEIVLEEGVFPKDFTLTLYSLTSVKYKGSNFLGREIRSRLGSVTFRKGTTGGSGWIVDSGRELEYTNAVLDKMMVLGEALAVIEDEQVSPAAAGQFNGNIWVLAGEEDAPKVATSMRTANWRTVEGGKENYRGGFIVLSFVQMGEDATIELKHDKTVSDSRYKPFWMPLEKDIIINENVSMIVVESDTHWKVIGINSKNEVIQAIETTHLNNAWLPMPLETANGFGIAGGLTAPQYRISLSQIHFKGGIYLDQTIENGTHKLMTTLPEEHRPVDEIRKPIKVVGISAPNDVEENAVLIITKDGEVNLKVRGGFTQTMFLYLDGNRFDLT